jgi:hypothetical protein
MGGGAKKFSLNALPITMQIPASPRALPEAIKS